MSTTNSIVPYGFCLCGCGERTRIAPQTKTQSGWGKGEPIPYRQGHAKRGRFLEWSMRRDLAEGYGTQPEPEFEQAIGGRK